MDASALEFNVTKDEFKARRMLLQRGDVVCKLETIYSIISF